MKTEPIKLNSLDFPNFIGSSKFSVIKAGLEETSNFNTTLCNQLKQFYRITVSIGYANIDKLDYNDTFIQSLIGERMVQIGLNSSDSMLPGYYLFKESRLVGYHPGTFDISKLDPEVQKASFWFGIAVGVVSGIATKSLASGLLTFSTVMDASTGMNIFKFFKEVLESKNELDIRRKQKIVFLTEIDKAYAFLKVSKFASDEEVKKARNKMLVEFHPDKSKEDKVARNAMSVNINEAYNIIMNHRKAAKNKFSFS